ncbi:DUF742 domain-containing protein [Streptomyces botrytidirepellens]|uniref:DUF742 domain-containing protein n=1 Tax=Streptomyces botrytidirepellens TaxID=2486417 RepID=A0A3M8WC79_9ACTN|nr:DUF742 domain-containing protein [Streptomyces botrytidirepellens]RNG26331.1 DUF742 domain-containing protein [Streptomyces botrytidirepellens]
MSTGEGPSGRRDQGAEDEQTFADVLNAFSFGKARRPRRKSGSGSGPESAARHQPEEAPPTAPPEPYAYPPQQDEQHTAWEGGHEQQQQGSSPSFVRAYTWTGGRTRSQHHFELETLVTTTDLGHQSAGFTHADHVPVIALCQEPTSVAEVSARLSVPLGVARVLLGDMADRGLIVVHETGTEEGEAPSVALMERVLTGLRRL